MNKNKITRRNFMKKTAAASAAALAAPHVITGTALGSGAIPPASERITLGHIGVGWRGNDLIKRFFDIPGAQCVAISDCFEERRKSTSEAIDAYYTGRMEKGSYGACAVYEDFRELLARKDIDAVVIATPDHWHVPVALHAIRAGKDVYVEKPLGIAVTWNQALRKELKHTEAVFQFGTQQRSIDRFRFACELAHNEKIGKLERIDVWAPGMIAPGHYERLYADGGSTEPIPVPDDLDYDMWIGPAPMSSYTKNRCTHEGTNHVYDNSLGFIAGWGVHPLDIALWGNYRDKTAPVEFEGTGVIPEKGLYNTISDWDVKCRFASGVKLHFMNTRTAKSVVKYRPFHDHGTTFIGSDGWVSVDRNGIHAGDKAVLDTKIKAEEIRLHKSTNHWQDFIDCIKSRSETVSPFESAFQSHIVSHMSDTSIRLKRKITWDPEKEKVVGDVTASQKLHRLLREPWSLGI